MPAHLEVDLSAVLRNARTLAVRCGVPLIPMVKADGYGMGAGAVAHALEAVAPWGFGVATVAEGAELRKLGVSRPIVVFTPLLERELTEARAAQLTPALGTPRTIAAWRSSGAPWHLAIDTGMARAGVAWRDAPSLREMVATFPPQGAFTHFHSAELDDNSREEQDRRFDEALRDLGLDGIMTHTDNSAAILRRGRSSRSAARPGIFLYGGETVGDAVVAAEPVAHLRAPIVEFRSCEPGDTVSYGAMFTATRPIRVATLACGYADGYPRNIGLDGRAGMSVLHQGRRIPIVGRVTMDMIMIDATDVKCSLGDVVTLIGRDGDEVITVAEVGASAGISPYEVLVGLNSRAERSHRGP